MTLALLLLTYSTGCGSLMQRTANLEDDELYLDHGEEFITDADYLAYAYEQAGYDAVGGDYAPDARQGDSFGSNFGYVPQSLRGRSMLRGYMTPYGAAGFGPNPYDPWGSSFYGGYNPYNSGFCNPQNPFGNPMYGGSLGYNSWGMNPYMGNSWGGGWNNGFNGGWGMNPYAYNPYNPYGGVGFYNGYNNWGNAWSGGGGDVYEVNTVVAPRTPIWASSAINSNGGGGRLLTNKVDDSGAQEGQPAAPMTIWRGIDALETKAASRSTRTARSTPATNSRSSSRTGSNSGRSSYSGSGNSGSSAQPASSRGSSSRKSTWSGSSSGSSRSSGSSTRPSTRSNSTRSSGNSSGRSSGRSSSGGSRGGRGGFPTP